MLSGKLICTLPFALKWLIKYKSLYLSVNSGCGIVAFSGTLINFILLNCLDTVKPFIPTITLINPSFVVSSQAEKD